MSPWSTHALRLLPSATRGHKVSRVVSHTPKTVTKLTERVLIVLLLLAAVIFILREARAVEPLMGPPGVSLEAFRAHPSHGECRPGWTIQEATGMFG